MILVSSIFCLTFSSSIELKGRGRLALYFLCETHKTILEIIGEEERCLESSHSYSTHNAQEESRGRGSMSRSKLLAIYFTCDNAFSLSN